MLCYVVDIVYIFKILQYNFKKYVTYIYNENNENNENDILYFSCSI